MGVVVSGQVSGLGVYGSGGCNHLGSSAYTGGSLAGGRIGRRACAGTEPGRATTHTQDRMSFTSLQLHPDLVRGTEALGFRDPTPIQRESIPPAMAGRDVLASAMTGSGKTAAFLLPVLHRLLERPRGATRALVLTPTRELAAQIDDHLRELARFTRLTSAAVYGGVGMEPQAAAFRKGVDVLVATPGRLLDHFQYDYATLDALEVLVLDEADRMLDMGFLPAIRKVMRHLPSRRQTLFFSATMPEPIEALATELLRDPVTIALQRKTAPARGITQAAYPVPDDLKPALLLRLLRGGEVGSAIAFTRTKHRANRLAEYLEKNGVPVARLHGNRSQKQRTEALAGFKDGKFRVMVATDIAQRGIDVEALEHVINVDVPNVVEDYIHRIGRTARADATGDAYTFFSPTEEKELRAIERAIGKALPRVTVADFDYRARAPEPFEIPLAVRIAEIRARKKEERERSRLKAERKAQREAEEAARAQTPAERRRAAGGGGGRRRRRR